MFESVKQEIDKRVESESCDAFYIFDAEDVRMKCQKWMEKIPRVTPFYAIKCNEHEKILQIIAENGFGFDCASEKEMKQVLEMKIPTEKIIFANTVKQASQLKFAAVNNVKKTTFDCPDELVKILTHHPTAEVVLRIRYDASSSKINLGPKFGCDPVIEAPELIKLCKKMNANLIGISFHVGSGTEDYEVFVSAIAAVKKLFDKAKNFGFTLNFVDIGGGFLGNDIKFLDFYAQSINAAIEKYFPDPSVKFIAEPGRFFCESAFTLVTQVILKRVTNGHRNYYVNESIFLSFIGVPLKFNADPELEIIRKTAKLEPIEYPSTVWGLTCSALDRIIETRMIPDIEIGDWLVFPNMGAYSTCLVTTFNGFKVGEIIEINQ
jgi:ornithine decarboxylase